MLNQLFEWQLHMPLKISRDRINILEYIYKWNVLILFHDEQLSYSRAIRQQEGIWTKTPFTSKCMFQQPADKKDDGKSVTCGKDMELCKISYVGWCPRESVCLGGLLTPGRAAHRCQVMLGMKTAAIFFFKGKIMKLQRAITAFSVCVMRWQPPQLLSKNVIFSPETLLNSICPGSWLSHQLKSMLSVPVYPMGLFLLCECLTERLSQAITIWPVRVISWLVANQPLSVTSHFFEIFFRESTMKSRKKTAIHLSASWMKITWMNLVCVSSNQPLKIWNSLWEEIFCAESMTYVFSKWMFWYLSQKLHIHITDLKLLNTFVPPAK